MWIKLAITLITLFLLFDEYFKVIENIKKKNRRKILLIALSLLSILSLIDIIIEVNDGKELVQKANNILLKSDTLINQSNVITADLKDNIESVKETGKSLIGIDSVLKGVRDSVSNQVEILNDAFNKSKQLVDLEQQIFDSKRPNIFLDNVEFVSAREDSTRFNIKYRIINKGERVATIKSIQTIFLGLSLRNKYLQHFTNPTDTKLDEYKIPFEGSLPIIFKADIPKLEIIEKADNGIFVLKVDYIDSDTNKLYSENYFANSKYINLGELTFFGADEMIRDAAKTYLVANELELYLVSEN